MNASKLFATSKERQLIPWLLLIDPRLIKTGKKKEGVFPGVHGGPESHVLCSLHRLPLLPFHSGWYTDWLVNAFPIQALYRVNIYSLISKISSIVESQLNF